VQLVRRERTRIDGGDGRVPGDDADLALLTRPVAAAGRVDRNAVPASRVEDRRPREHARLAERLILGPLEEPQTDAVRVRLRQLDGGLGAQLAAAAFSARYFAIHRAPHSSRPSRKSPARTASTHCGARASMIALVRP